MIWLIIAAVFFSAVVLWMLIETRGTLHLLWVIPVCIGLITGTYQWAYSMFGYPTDVYNVGDEFTLLSYYIPNEEDKIVVWVLLQGEEDPKAIVIPYDPDEQENLQSVAEQMASGGKFMGQFGQGEQEKGQKEGEGDGESGQGTLKSSGGMLNFTPLTVEHFLPEKDYVKRERLSLK